MAMKNILCFIFAVSMLSACSAGSGSSGVSANSADSTPLLVANKSMANDQLAYASPLAGGLVGLLYIQPRNLMSVPDTQVTGCGQDGAGALGIQSYLSQPTWASQQLIFTDLFVPTRNFQLGFPAPGPSGSLISVNSFFTIDAKGFFHLSSTDTEGDYQFALIADDAAQLQINNNGVTTMMVDDQKPAGPNNGCEEQTQSAHMSCSTTWGNQATTNYYTVHLTPGQLLPIELTYWQGPGGGLSMMAFYRKVADTTNPADLTDTSCGQELGFNEGSDSLNEVLSTWTPISFANLIPTPQ